VRRGDTIALVGATGLVSGPHLHYEVEVNGREVDPLNFIIADAIPD
jgi:murein DD-endopeptidase MepM/ murein hydrolase activator NlpD